MAAVWSVEPSETKMNLSLSPDSPVKGFSTLAAIQLSSLNTTINATSGNSGLDAFFCRSERPPDGQHKQKNKTIANIGIERLPN
jgi:hypothetical protein